MAENQAATICGGEFDFRKFHFQDETDGNYDSNANRSTE